MQIRVYILILNRKRGESVVKVENNETGYHAASCAIGYTNIMQSGVSKYNKSIMWIY